MKGERLQREGGRGKEINRETGREEGRNKEIQWIYANSLCSVVWSTKTIWKQYQLFNKDLISYIFQGINQKYLKASHGNTHNYSIVHISVTIT